MAEAVRLHAHHLARREFMVFRLGEQEFSVDIASVREARLFSVAARIPHAPDYVLGVINLRGIVLPIVDLRARLRLAPLSSGNTRVVIVVETQRKLIGLLADAVCDIVEVDEAALGGAPAVDDERVGALVKSVITIGDRVIGVLSPDTIIDIDGGSM